MAALLQTYLGDILHVISQDLLIPVVIGLLLFIGYALFCIGSVIAETLTMHRHYHVDMPPFLAALDTASPDRVPQVIAESGLLNRQKIALLTLWDYRVLSDESYVALAKRLLSNEKLRYDRVVARNEGASKLAPMLGLMGTLIPLGPGIGALAKGDLNSLAASLIIAFDTTVAGLASAFVCFIVGRIRRNRYKDYLVALESSMTTIIDKVRTMRAEGRLDVTGPQNSARTFAAAVGREKHLKDERGARAIADKVAREEGEAAQAAQQATATAAEAARAMAKALAPASTQAASRNGRPSGTGAAFAQMGGES